MIAATDLRNAVREAYSLAARRPDAAHPFPTGARFAASLGYAEPLLHDHPRSADAFTGVSCIPGFAEVGRGMMVLDLGCGAGLDALAIGPRVRGMVGIDFSAEMLERAAAHMPVTQGDAERLPFRDACFDAVLANGIFNLNPGRSEIMAETARVLKPGGALWGAELILNGPAPDATLDNWFA